MGDCSENDLACILRIMGPQENVQYLVTTNYNANWGSSVIYFVNENENSILISWDTLIALLVSSEFCCFCHRKVWKNIRYMFTLGPGRT